MRRRKHATLFRRGLRRPMRMRDVWEIVGLTIAFMLLITAGGLSMIALTLMFGGQ